MASTFGSNLKITIFGESHNEAIGLVIDSLKPGVYIDKDFINKELEKRKPQGDLSTLRKEKDEVIFLSGVFNGYSDGTPLAFIIKNEDVDSSAYTLGDVRPSHGDYTYYVKYNGYNDYRGGGMSSGRMTAVLVVLGAICKSILKDYGISIVSHIKSIHNIYDDKFDFENIDKQIENIKDEKFFCLNKNKAELMKNEIRKYAALNDSVGGEIETAILNCKAGLGNPYFDSVESILSHLMFSIPSVKAISFGDGYDFASNTGSEVKDEMIYKDDKVKFLSNHNGGINAGITNGEPIVFSCVIKPTPSIKQTMQSVNLKNKENISLNIKGRHDPCIVLRVRSVIEALSAYAILDFMMGNKNA